MLMTAALHMDSFHGHGPSPSSYTPPPPWLLADDDNNTHRRDQLLICDLAASPAPATAAAAAPPNHHHHRAAARRVSNKRRPRPSRKVPTTYIAADPASFRRMVHQITGADHLPLPAPPPPASLCRPAPSRAAGSLTLPTLDTSAFLLGRVAGVAAAPALEAGAAGVVGRRPCDDYNSNSGSSSCGGGGFPTLDSSIWDTTTTLF